MKRKASELEEGSSVATGTSHSPLSDSSVSFISSPGPNAIGPVPRNFAPGQLVRGNNYTNLRTRKRIRDNRPDIDTIHQNTLRKLYSAQRHGSPALLQAHPPANIDQPIGALHVTSKAPPTQQNLHSFFNITSSPTSSTNMSHHYKQLQPLDQQCICEDCGNDLGTSHANNDDIMMLDNSQDREPNLFEDYLCANCQRQVCDLCAVRGDHRICLECAMPGGGG